MVDMNKKEIEVVLMIGQKQGGTISKVKRRMEVSERIDMSLVS